MYMMRIRVVTTFVIVFGVFVIGWIISTSFQNDEYTKNLEEIEQCLLLADGYQKISCLGPSIAQITKKGSAQTAIDLLQNLQKEGFIPDCHLLAHVVGEANLEKYNFDSGKAFSSCSFGCIEGCFHGVMEAYVSSKVDQTQISSLIKGMCESVSSNSLLRRQCIHGVGHGLLSQNYLSLNDAINACDYFGNTFRIETCRGGVFMENMDLHLNFNEDYLRKILPSICSDIFELNNDDLSFTCVDAIGEGLMFYTGHNVEKSYQLCEELPSIYVSICKAAAKKERDIVGRHL